jgi:CRP/FNR family cyclic AMP-dependent transcriptional regulator
MGETGDKVYTGSRVGEVFGWGSLIGRDTYGGTPSARHRSWSLKLDRDRLLKMLDSDMESGYLFFRQLSTGPGGRLVQAYHRMDLDNEWEDTMENPDMQATLQSSRFLKNIAPGAPGNHFQALQRRSPMRPGRIFSGRVILAKTCYIIIEGYVFLERAMDIGSHKGSVVIDALGKGRTLGCWSTLLGEPHVLLSSANCQKDSTVIRLKGGQLRKCMEEDTEFGFFHARTSLCYLLRDRIQAAYGAMDKI